MVEALALRMGLVVSERNGCKNLQAESDCAELIKVVD